MFIFFCARDTQKIKNPSCNAFWKRSDTNLKTVIPGRLLMYQILKRVISPRDEVINPFTGKFPVLIIYLIA
jgi:hypothetical protein